MTAIANDISYDDIFSFQLKRFGKPIVSKQKTLHKRFIKKRRVWESNIDKKAPNLQFSAQK